MARNDIINTDGTIKWDTVGGFKDSIDRNTASLADIALNVKSYGAKGDGVTDDTTAIQNAINDCPVNGVVYFPNPNSVYRINSTLTLNKSIKLMGATKGVVIKHYGTGASIKITCWDWSIENLEFDGDGTNQLNGDGVTYTYGVGATSQYGIELDGTNGGVNRFSLKNVKASYHANHGIYCHSGVWIGLFETCELFYNGQDGINAVNSGAVQNGNNFTFIGGSYSSNGRDGIQWGAANGTFLNVDAENNSKGGLCINGGIAANIIGGYLENNHEEQLRLDATNAAISYSMKGTYLNSNFAGTGAGNSLIKAVGTNGITQTIEDIVPTIGGSALSHFGDFANLPTLGSYLRYTDNYGTLTSKFVNLGNMKVIISPKDIMLNGKFDGKGNITFTNDNQSDNFFSVGIKTVEFKTPLAKGDMITGIFVYLTTNSTSQITVTATINDIYFSGGNTQTTITSSITGSGTVSLIPTSPIYVDSLSGITLSLSFSSPSTGTNLIIGNPVLRTA